MTTSLKITLPLILGGLALVVIGFKAGDMDNAKHPDNFLFLKGSPLGKTVSRLTNRAVDQEWEQGEMTLPPVNPDAKTNKIGGPIDLAKRAGYSADMMAYALNERTHDSPNMDRLRQKIRGDLKQRLKNGFELDPTSGPALQLTLMFLTEMDGPQYDNAEMRNKRIQECDAYIDRALAAYNLDPKTGNPDHFVNAAEATFAKLLVRHTLDHSYDVARPETRELRAQISEKTGKKMQAYLQGALDIQKIQQDTGVWAHRSHYRKQDFWTGLQYTNRLARSINGGVRADNAEVLEDRVGTTLDKIQGMQERADYIKTFTEDTFGKDLRNLLCPDCGHAHGPGETHEPGHTHDTPPTGENGKK